MPHEANSGCYKTRNKMDKLLSILFYFSLISIACGVVIKLPIDVPSVNIYLFDIAAISTFLTSLLNFNKFRYIIKHDPIIRYFGIFILICFVSIILSPIKLTLSDKLISSLYIVRLIIYFSIYLSVIYLLKVKILTREKIIKYLSITGIILAVAGWIQYFFYPDLRNLFYLGWDPHYKRIFSTIFDPNYLGLIFVLTTIALFEFKKSTMNIWALRIFIFITLLFTYSRSSYVSLIISAFYYSITRKKSVAIILVIAAFISTIFFLPRRGGEGVKLERIFSINERITSMNEGIRLFTDHPLIGVGFNTLKYAKIQYGFIIPNTIDNHSSTGIENSFIFVAATAGLLGLIIYFILLYKIFITGADIVKISLIAVVVHGLFMNSLFFPPVMIWIWIIAGTGSGILKDYK